MPVPKHRLSRSRTRRRRSANDKCYTPGRSICPQCGAVKRPHCVCPNCGFYKGKEVIVVDDE